MVKGTADSQALRHISSRYGDSKGTLLSRCVYGDEYMLACQPQWLWVLRLHNWNWRQTVMHNQETAFVVIIAASVYSNDKVLAGSKSGAKPYHCLLNSICSPPWWTVQPREHLKSTQQSFGFRLNRRMEVPHPLYSDIESPSQQPLC